MISLDMLDCPMYSLSLSTWNFLCWMGWGDHSVSFTLWVFVWDPSFMLKSYGVVVVVGSGGGLQDFSFSPGPCVLSRSRSGPDWTWPGPELDLNWTGPDLDRDLSLTTIHLIGSLISHDNTNINMLCNTISISFVCKKNLSFLESVWTPDLLFDQ